MKDHEETRAFWDRVADDWKVQVGDEGDGNRRLNSDPVLWKMVGDVASREVLDAGCGTGYLSKNLQDAGTRVTGIDFSEGMIALARAAYPAVAFRVDSCSELSTVPDAAFEVVVSNYVLMDTPRLEETTNAFHRALRPGGIAVLIFSHPCFPQGRATSSERAADRSPHATTTRVASGAPCSLTRGIAGQREPSPPAGAYFEAISSCPPARGALEDKEYSA